MQLLRILGPQLEQLINEGHPDLHAFYDALKKEKLVSEEEFQELHVTFGWWGVVGGGEWLGFVQLVMVGV